MSGPRLSAEQRQQQGNASPAGACSCTEALCAVTPRRLLCHVFGSKRGAKPALGLPGGKLPPASISPALHSRMLSVHNHPPASVLLKSRIFVIIMN